MSDRVTDNQAAHRFELETDGELSVLEYDRKPDTLVLRHTEVPTALRGRGLGKILVMAAVDAAAREDRRVVPICPFAKALLQKQ